MKRVMKKVKSHYHAKPALLMTGQCTIKKRFCESSNLIMFAMLKQLHGATVADNKND
jgi:hypothetical protein